MQRLNLKVNQSYDCCIFQCHIFKEIQWKISVLKIDCQGKISEDFFRNSAIGLNRYPFS
jgi:hypothetical protein